MTERGDPCSGCDQLEQRPRTAPWCRRGAFYGQVGCLRQSRAPRRTDGDDGRKQAGKRRR